MKSYSNKFREILEIEAAAIENSARRPVGDAFDNAVERLLSCTGKVVLLGVGKSALIANKIADTMSSTGAAAIFLHASDALHGSLGVVGANDVVIALSNSGETDEIVALLPSLKQRGVMLIAIVGNLDSALARAADFILDATVDREACPLNLAPTTSTTVALAIGDALAMTLMDARGLTPEDFAANHPAGRLGKRLTVRVADLMHESPNVGPRDGWLEVVKAISQYALGAVNVIDEGKLVGIVTDGDLRRTIERTAPAEFDSLTASAMMTAGPITISSDALAFDALQIMENRPSQISVLPVVAEDGGAVGLLRLHDIVRSGI